MSGIQKLIKYKLLSYLLIINCEYLKSTVVTMKLSNLFFSNEVFQYGLKSYRKYSYLGFNKGITLQLELIHSFY